MSIQVFAKVIIQRPDGQILVLRRSSTDSRRPGEWDFPGGGVEAGEGPGEGAARELIEEAAIIVNPKTLTLLYAATSYHQPTNDSNTRLLFYCTVNDESAANIRLSHEHDDHKWQTIRRALAEHPHPIYKAGLQYALDHDLLA